MRSFGRMNRFTQKPEITDYGTLVDLTRSGHHANSNSPFGEHQQHGILAAQLSFLTDGSLPLLRTPSEFGAAIICGSAGNIRHRTAPVRKRVDRRC